MRGERMTAMERLMLNGEPFRYIEMCDQFAQGMNKPGIVPATMQRLLDAGWIRHIPDPDGPGSIRWVATDLVRRRALEEADHG